MENLLSVERKRQAGGLVHFGYSTDEQFPKNGIVFEDIIEHEEGHMSKQSLEHLPAIKSAESQQSFNESVDDGTYLPQSYIIIKVAPNISERTLVWLVGKIRGKRHDGGAELAVLKEPYNEKEGVVLHISASKIKFLEAAEEMEITKRDKNGVMRDFVVSDLEEFLGEDMHVEDLLTVTERQKIVRHELENIRALAEDDSIPGYPNIELYEGQSILHVCLQTDIIRNVYPLHDKEALKKLGRKWYLNLFKEQPFEEIREYFGEGVALYFSFLSYYTASLLFPLFLGIVQLLVSAETLPFFCVFNVVWVTVFLELWKRKSNALAFKWGTIGMTSLDEPRPNFHGQMGVDLVTGKRQPQYPRIKTNLKMYCVSFPIVFLCQAAAFVIMLISFWMEDYVRKLDTEWSGTLQPLPSILYTALVYIMNVYYRKLATRLTEWENHRTQSQYDRHRVSKLVLFEFVNNFMSLFYIAFVIQDLEMLRTQLATMLIILQAINNVQEAILPLFLKFSQEKVTQMKKYLRKKTTKEQRSTSGFKRSYSTYEPLHDITEIPADDSRILDSEKEGEMENYEGTYDDYLEMFIQFGYVVLFSSVYPIAAFWAVFNNILEIRADAFKLCVVFQRPMGKRVKDIGAWQKAFEMVGALSIMTNCGLLCLSPQMRSYAPDYSSVKWCMMFVMLEHLLMGLRYLLNIAISDKPEWVRVALARTNYESKKALKFERAVKSRRILTRRFKTVHGPHGH